MKTLIQIRQIKIWNRLFAQGLVSSSILVTLKMVWFARGLQETLLAVTKGIEFLFLLSAAYFAAIAIGFILELIMSRLFGEPNNEIKLAKNFKNDNHNLQSIDELQLQIDEFFEVNKQGQITKTIPTKGNKLTQQIVKRFEDESGTS